MTLDDVSMSRAEKQSAQTLVKEYSGSASHLVIFTFQIGAATLQLPVDSIPIVNPVTTAGPAAAPGNAQAGAAANKSTTAAGSTLATAGAKGSGTGVGAGPGAKATSAGGVGAAAATTVAFGPEEDPNKPPDEYVALWVAFKSDPKINSS
jgi:hypothetical protein